MSGLGHTDRSAGEADCVHADAGFLRSAQLADDEIAVCSYMAADGRCPICKPEHEDAYTEAVRFRREGHDPEPA